MHALGGMTVEWSDDEGQSWTGPSIATGYSVQDHQTIASSPYGGLLHETLWVFCINGNYPAPLCSASQDGGFTWGPEVPGAPVDCQSGGLSAHIIGAENGNFSMFFWNPVLGWLWEPIFVISAHFWGPFWRPFWSLFGYHFCIDV